MRELTILSYDYVPDVLERRGPFRKRHLGLLAEHGCVMGGAVGEPPHGALLVFDERTDAEAFLARDPYVANGLVMASRIDSWALAVG